MPANMANIAPIAITTGEPAGIGPDVSLQIMQQAHDEAWSNELILLGDRDLLVERCMALGLNPDLLKHIHIQSIKLNTPSTPGVLDSRNAGYVLALLDQAIRGCQAGIYSAMVTAPLQKSIIADTGIAFSGHTEYLAEKSNTPHVVMMLAGAGMRVALATTHIPLSKVPDAITYPSLQNTLNVLVYDLKHKFGIAKPRVLVAGLNPHAGEHGHLGSEEIDIIYPVITHFQQQGERVSGPYPADTLFQAKYLNQCDAVLAMYHDQGLPVLKHASFGEGVNITLGLPFIRTSVDHGTALDLAATGKANASSLLAAINTAREMVKQSHATQRATS
jgi:4-hydroxythreonine-4-phosphate dehydrogenase